MTSRYMTPPFAEELSSRMGCAAEREILPPLDFLEEALRPPPLYFETDERAYQGVCRMFRAVSQPRMRTLDALYLCFPVLSRRGSSVPHL